MSVDSLARAAEPLIDNAFVEQPLLSRDYTNALFHILLEVELQLKREDTSEAQERAIRLDTLVNILKYAIGWARTARGSKQTSEHDFEDARLEAHRLVAAASNYMFFVVAYTYGSRNVLDLDLAGHHLRTTRVLVDETRYEAYNMLLKPTLEGGEPRRGHTFVLTPTAPRLRVRLRLARCPLHNYGKCDV